MIPPETIGAAWVVAWAVSLALIPYALLRRRWQLLYGATAVFVGASFNIMCMITSYISL